MAAPGFRTRPRSRNNGEVNRWTPCRILLSLGLECQVSHTYKLSDILQVYCPPPHFLRDASQGSGALSLARRFLSPPVGRLPGLPAVSTCIILALGLSHFWEPRVSSLAFQKPLAAIARPEPLLLTAHGTRVGLRAPRHPNTRRLRVFADSRRTRRGMSSGVISQASPILPNPLCFYFNPTHYS